MTSAAPEPPHDLLVALREDFAQDEPFCWWDSIDDRSLPALDIEAARAGSDFASDLIELADELSLRLATEEGAAGDFASELSEGLPGPLRHQRALEKLFESSSAQPSELVERALVLALGELESDRR